MGSSSEVRGSCPDFRTSALKSRTAPGWRWDARGLMGLYSFKWKKWKSLPQVV